MRCEVGGGNPGGQGSANQDYLYEESGAERRLDHEALAACCSGGVRSRVYQKQGRAGRPGCPRRANKGLKARVVVQYGEGLINTNRHGIFSERQRPLEISQAQLLPAAVRVEFD